MKRRSMLRPYTAARRAATACPLERFGVFAGWPERPCWKVGSRRTEGKARRK